MPFWSWESNASQRPSGDHWGLPCCFPRPLVSWMVFDPCASVTKISPASPERVDENTMFLPSGENWGLVSMRVERMKGAGDPPASILQMSTSLLLSV